MTKDPRALTQLSASDYEAIELAVMETARGRWFLHEFAARNRTADTNMLLGAMARLEGAVGGERAMEQVERVRFDLLEMAKSIAGLKVELDQHENGPEGGRLGQATNALDGIVRTTEQATSNILSAAEAIQEIAWSLREQKHDEAICDRIDKLATDIYAACTFQDLTAQRTQKVVRTLRFLEGRINALIDAWSATEAPMRDRTGRDDPGLGGAGPETDGVTPLPFDGRLADSSSALLMLPASAELTQNDVDFVIVDDEMRDGPHDGEPAMPMALPLPDAADETCPGASQASDGVDDIAFGPEETVFEAAAPDCVPATPPGPDHDLMAGDEPQLIVGDLDMPDVDLPPEDADLLLDRSPDKRDDALTEDEQSRPEHSASLAQIDAMSAVMKARIFS